MSNVAKVVRGLAVVGVVAGLGIVIGWFVSRQGDITPITSLPPATNQPLAVAPPPVEQPPAPAPEPLPVPSARPQPQEVTSQPDQPAVDWEQTLDDILLSGDNENSKADKILALIPQVPAEAQQELAQHLVNMVRDDHYDGTAQLLTNAATSADVSSVLMNDLLNRSNALKLPMLLAIARNDSHPLKDQALDLLGLLTQEDDGTNWDQWSTTIDTWLQNNPQ